MIHAKNRHKHSGMGHVMFEVGNSDRNEKTYILVHLDFITTHCIFCSSSYQLNTYRSNGCFIIYK